MSLLIDRGPVTRVTLNRPDVRNAFNGALIADLTAFAESVPDDGSVRVERSCSMAVIARSNAYFTPRERAWRSGSA